MDCGFTREGHWFRYRAAAIIVENEHILFACNEVDDYYYSVGGGVHHGESAEEAVIREVYEETGLKLTSYTLRGIITFVSDKWGCEYMHLYTADGFEGSLNEETNDCAEGILQWIPKTKVLDLNLWEGDKIFLKLLMEKENVFSLKLEYQGDALMRWQCREW